MIHTNKVYAKLLEVHEVQRLNFRLMELASFNRYDGPKVVKDLLDHRELWQACIMDRGSYSEASIINKIESSYFINLIKLRDMSRDCVKRLGEQIWNIDTLFILAPKSLEKKKELLKLSKTWLADEVKWMEPKRASYYLGGAPKGTKILQVWWD